MKINVIKWEAVPNLAHGEIILNMQVNLIKYFQPWKNKLLSYKTGSQQLLYKNKNHNIGKKAGSKQFHF